MISAASHRSWSLLFTFFLCSATLLAACNGSGRVTPTLTSVPTPVVTPTATERPSTALLVVPQGADPSLAESIRKTAAELAKASGLAFAEQATLAATDLTVSTRVVIVLAPDPGLVNLAAAAPNTPLIGIGISLPEGDALPANISSIETGEQQQAFIAGFIAAIVAPDWRVGILSQADAPTSQTLRDAFMNGASYLCGICNPKYPPYTSYPVAVEITPGSDWNAAVAGLTEKTLQAAYVDPALNSPDLLNGIAQAGINLIGTTSPEEALHPHWVATLHSDPASALKQAWPTLLAGKSSHLTAEIQLTDVNSDLLTPGRLQQVETTIHNLQAGFILPSDVPLP